MRRTDRLWLAYWPAGLAAGAIALALTLTSNHEDRPIATLALGLVVGWSFIAGGLMGWARRPGNRTGHLMVGVGFGVFLTALSEANHSLPYTLGSAFGVVFLALFAHLLVAYPSGRIADPLERKLVGTTYVFAIVGGVASHWDESTGDMIVRGIVGWGGKGVRGDTDRMRLVPAG